jgi:hypothetical protein
MAAPAFSVVRAAWSALLPRRTRRAPTWAAGRVYLGLLDRAGAGDRPGAARTDAAPIRCAVGCRPQRARLRAGNGRQRRSARDLLERSCALDMPLAARCRCAQPAGWRPALAAGGGRAQQPAGATLLTPHPTEAARLLGCDTAQVQSDRGNAALQLAAATRQWWSSRVVAALSPRPTGAGSSTPPVIPASATAGTGDVLSGFIVALLGQGWPALEAMLAGVHLHGLAADERVAGWLWAGRTDRRRDHRQRARLLQPLDRAWPFDSQAVASLRTGSVLLCLCALFLFSALDATAKHLSAFLAVPLLVWARYLVHLLIMVLTILPGRGAAWFSPSRPWLMAAARRDAGRRHAARTTRAVHPAACGNDGAGLRRSLAGGVVGRPTARRAGAFARTWLATVAGFAGVLLIARPGGNLAATGVACALARRCATPPTRS